MATDALTVARKIEAKKKEILALFDAARAEQRERDARKADEYAGETARLIAAAIRSGR